MIPNTISTYIHIQQCRRHGVQLVSSYSPSPTPNQPTTRRETIPAPQHLLSPLIKWHQQARALLSADIRAKETTRGQPSGGRSSPSSCPAPPRPSVHPSIRGIASLLNPIAVFTKRRYTPAHTSVSRVHSQRASASSSSRPSIPSSSSPVNKKKGKR